MPPASIAVTVGVAALISNVTGALVAEVTSELVLVKVATTVYLPTSVGAVDDPEAPTLLPL